MKIFHNPKCSKSRETLGLLEDEGTEPDVVEYLQAFPSKEELKEIVEKLSLPVTSIIRFKESLAKELEISAKDERSLDEWLEILCHNPKLLERPIVVKGNRAVLGRPPENVRELF
jgi:arsenate reductase